MSKSESELKQTMLKTPRANAGNRYKDVLSAVTGRKHANTPASPVQVDKQYLHALLQDPEDDYADIFTPHLTHSDTNSQNVGFSKKVRSAPAHVVSPDTQPNHEATASNKRAIHAEIDNLKAQCDDLELQLAKAKLEKRQSKLVKALSDLSVELQPGNDAGPAEGPSGTISKSVVKKSKQIVDFLFLSSLDSIEEEGQVIEIGGGAKLHLDKKKTPLSQVTMEQWGYASLNIMKELLRCGELSQQDILGYVGYTQCIFRLASNHVWHSVLLYDKEYRDMQAIEGFKWGEDQKNLRDFHLVPKSNSSTMKALNIMAKTPNMNNENVKPQSFKKVARGPFMPDGREICRKFNSGNCDFQNCRMAHNCAICFSRHKAVEHPKKEIPKNRQNSAE